MARIAQLLPYSLYSSIFFTLLV